MTGTARHILRSKRGVQETFLLSRLLFEGAAWHSTFNGLLGPPAQHMNKDDEGEHICFGLPEKYQKLPEDRKMVQE